MSPPLTPSIPNSLNDSKVSIIHSVDLNFKFRESELQIRYQQSERGSREGHDCKIIKYGERSQELSKVSRPVESPGLVDPRVTVVTTRDESSRRGTLVTDPCPFPRLLTTETMSGNAKDGLMSTSTPICLYIRYVHRNRIDSVTKSFTSGVLSSQS